MLHKVTRSPETRSAKRTRERGSKGPWRVRGRERARSHAEGWRTGERRVEVLMKQEEGRGRTRFVRQQQGEGPGRAGRQGLADGNRKPEIVLKKRLTSIPAGWPLSQDALMMQSRVSTMRFAFNSASTHQVSDRRLEDALLNGRKRLLELLRVAAYIPKPSAHFPRTDPGAHRGCEAHVAQVKCTMSGRAASFRYSGRNLLSMYAQPVG